ncbi:MAG: cupredoxin domain-containing protein [Ferruginibacter sp.]
MRKLQSFTFILLSFLIYSCDKNETGFTAVGGQLPAHYIVIKDSSFSPSTLSVVAGSTVTFINQTALPSTVESNDTIAIKPVNVAASGSYTFKVNNPGAIPYHSVSHPSATGIIIVSP